LVVIFYGCLLRDIVENTILVRPIRIYGDPGIGCTDDPTVISPVHDIDRVLRKSNQRQAFELSSDDSEAFISESRKSSEFSSLLSVGSTSSMIDGESSDVCLFGFP